MSLRTEIEEPSKYRIPGSDGELAPGTDLWRKGLVYTARAGLDFCQSSRENYRITVLFKRLIGTAQPFRGFHDLYQRVVVIANHRVSQLTCSGTKETPDKIVLGHRWCWIGENVAMALITFGVRCPDQSCVDMRGEPLATEEALRSPGGTTLEELALLAPQSVDEILNEFDFTNPSTQNSDVITLSYGGPISGGEAVDFWPFVERAERLARSYYGLLQNLGEAGSQPFNVTRREWFLATPTFVTIHICFNQWAESDR